MRVALLRIVCCFCVHRRALHRPRAAESKRESPFAARKKPNGAGASGTGHDTSSGLSPYERLPQCACRGGKAYLNKGGGHGSLRLAARSFFCSI